jgi:hypothetical protein
VRGFTDENDARVPDPVEDRFVGIFRVRQGSGGGAIVQ